MVKQRNRPPSAFIPKFEEWLDETITVTRPMRTVLPRGLQSKNLAAPVVSVRVPDERRDAIERASALLGMKFSNFMLWTAYWTAIEILKEHERYKKSYNLPP